MTDIITLNPSDLITVTRELVVDYPVSLRPYVDKGFNCQGCRKRHVDNRHIIEGKYIVKQGEYRYGYNSGWNGYRGLEEVKPNLRFCGSEECFNMILLKHADELAKYKKLQKTPYPVENERVMCKKCKTWRAKPTKKEPKPIFYQAWININGVDTKDKSLCSVSCFKQYYTRERPW